jgi:glycosyltransferase involved in cell wall biosynthesis
MALGLPGIGPSVGGIPELLAGRGWLTAPDHPQSLTEAILEALGDRAKVDLFGARAKAFVASTYAASQILSRYRQLLSLSGGSRGDLHLS